MLAKGLRHGIADYYLLESEAFMASDRRQRLEDQWQLAALEQISHDVDATAATLNKEKIKEKYFRPLLLCQWWCKSVEHKYNCEGNLAYTRLKTAMQCDSSMRVQVLRFSVFKFKDAFEVGTNPHVFNSFLWLPSSSMWLYTLLRKLFALC